MTLRHWICYHTRHIQWLCLAANGCKTIQSNPIHPSMASCTESRWGPYAAYLKRSLSASSARPRSSGLQLLACAFAPIWAAFPPSSSNQPLLPTFRQGDSHKPHCSVQAGHLESPRLTHQPTKQKLKRPSRYHPHHHNHSKAGHFWSPLAPRPSAGASITQNTPHLLNQNLPAACRSSSRTSGNWRLWEARRRP